jgi:hypothetical protein
MQKAAMSSSEEKRENGSALMIMGWVLMLSIIGVQLRRRNR